MKKSKNNVGVQLELPFKEGDKLYVTAQKGINLLSNFSEKEKDEIRKNTKENQEEDEEVLLSRQRANELDASIFDEEE